MYAYCLNNPVKYSDPSGKVAVVDDLAFLVFVTIGITLTIIIVSPPVQNLLAGLS